MVPTLVSMAPHGAHFRSVFEQPECATVELRPAPSTEHFSGSDSSTRKAEPGSLGRPEACTNDLFKEKCDAACEHVFESYCGDGPTKCGAASA